MCTAIHYKSNSAFFGRNLDLHYSYDEKVTIAPRNYPLKFRHENEIESHYAIIGMATIADNYPLYYDAMNEKGLAVAGLNFPDNACYLEKKDGFSNIAPFEFIPWLLAKCETVDDAVLLIKKTSLLNEAFSTEFPTAPLHFMIADKTRSVTVEPLADGLKIYENNVCVLTNNPTFDIQCFNLNNYMFLSQEGHITHFSEKLGLKPYASGMGGLGLPGDFSSMSRFVKTAFCLLNSPEEETDTKSLAQFFHILEAVAVPKGSVLIGGKSEITFYTSCMNLEKTEYYYRTYQNPQISVIKLAKADLSDTKLQAFSINTPPRIYEIN